MKQKEQIFSNRSGNFICEITEGDEFKDIDKDTTLVKCVERNDHYTVYLKHLYYPREIVSLLIKLRPGLHYATNHNLGPAITPEVDNLFRRIRVLLASENIEVNVESLLKAIKEYMLKLDSATTIQGTMLETNTIHLKITKPTKLIVEDPDGLLTIEFKRKE